MSDSPRTDKEERFAFRQGIVFSDFARQLERELAAANAALAVERKDAERYRWFRTRCLWDADSFPWPKDFEYPDAALDDQGMMLDAAIDAAVMGGK